VGLNAGEFSELRQSESLMDGDALDVISGICRGHVDYVELRAVRRNLDVQVPTAPSAAGQIRHTATVGIQRLNREHIAAAGTVATSSRVIGSGDVRCRAAGVKSEGVKRGPKPQPVWPTIVICQAPERSALTMFPVAELGAVMATATRAKARRAMRAVPVDNGFSWSYSFDVLILERSLLVLPHPPLMHRPATLLLSRKAENKRKVDHGTRIFFQRQGHLEAGVAVSYFRPKA
jgi:hypothetical protein